MTNFLVKIGSNLAQNWSIFLAIYRGVFLARNVSQNHFPFSREMREMCRSICKRFSTKCVFFNGLLHLYKHFHKLHLNFLNWILTDVASLEITEYTTWVKSPHYLFIFHLYVKKFHIVFLCEEFQINFELSQVTSTKQKIENG